MDSLTIFLLVGFSLVFLIGTLGNALVWIVCRQVRSRSPNSFERMIYYLAFSDMLTSFINPPLFIYWQLTGYSKWHFGDVLCKILPSINTISINISIGFILIITIDRCRSIVLPFKTALSTVQLRVIVSVVIIISIMIELPYIVLLTVLPEIAVNIKCYSDMQNMNTITFQQHLTVYDAKCNITIDALRKMQTSVPFNEPLNATCIVDHCHDRSPICTPYNDKSVHVYQISEITIMMLKISFFLVVFVVSNIFIYKDIRRNHRKSSRTSLPGLKSKKIFLILTWMSVVFSILVFPKDIFYILFNIYYFTKANIEFYLATEINGILKLLQVSNCCANIFIYAKLHTKFRRGVHDLSKSLINSSDKALRRNTLSENNNLEVQRLTTV